MTDDAAGPPPTTYVGVSDQWVLIGLLVLGAVLASNSLPDLLWLPLTSAVFVARHPDTWLPLLVVLTLMGSAFVLEIRGRSHAFGRFSSTIVGIAGVAGVVWFFRAGDLNWHATPDWQKEWTYYTAIKESLGRGQLPWFLNETFQGTDRFFANPETNIAPWTALLIWMDVTPFVVLQCAAFLLLGVAATYQLARDLRIGPVATFAFISILLMNGHLIAHLHTGHGQWIGYFVFPWMFLFLHRVAVGDMSHRTMAGLAIALALIELVGGWHPFVWCVIFVGVFVAINRARWRFGASFALLLAGLSAVRILPVLTIYPVHEGQFIGSYQRLSILALALVGEIRKDIDYLNWWEYDAYVGWVGLLLVAAGLSAPLGRMWRHSVATLWAPSAALVVLSTFNIYQWTLYYLPGFDSERVASRLLIVGLLGFSLIGCVQLNAWLVSAVRSRTRLAALALAGLLMATQLIVHTNGRRPTSSEGKGPPSINVVNTRRPEAAYLASVGAGALLTMISLGVAIRMWRRPAASTP